ncbi:MAG: nucleotidyltransferase domain-containing protein [Candidatus Woesearchaeota archaeon]
MSSELLKNKVFNSLINRFHKENKSEILDIVLFGSSVRGKRKPNDVDLLLIFREKESIDTAYELRKLLKVLDYDFQIITKTYDKLFDKHFVAREAFLGEGYSLIKKMNISEGLGYTTKTIFKYSLKGFTQSRRMQLQYALYGRDKKSGIVNEFGLVKFADAVFLCPTENADKLKEFLEYWKINFESFPLLIPSRQS